MEVTVTNSYRDKISEKVLNFTCKNYYFQAIGTSLFIFSFFNFNECDLEFSIGYYGFGIWGSLFTLIAVVTDLLNMCAFVDCKHLFNSSDHVTANCRLHGWLSKISTLTLFAALAWSLSDLVIFSNRPSDIDCKQFDWETKKEDLIMFWVLELQFLTCKLFYSLCYLSDHIVYSGKTSKKCL